MAARSNTIQVLLPVADQQGLTAHRRFEVDFGGMQINKWKLLALIEFGYQLNETTLEVSLDDARMEVHILQLACATRLHGRAVPWCLQE